MGLKSSIVVVSEYTIKKPRGGGSRGGTPGDYVLRYMSRDGASERVAPVRQDTEDFILRYMARDKAAEPLTGAPEIEDALHKVDRYGGVAFANGILALSDRELRKRSKGIQDAFDSGKTVIKTVLSFEEGYLREQGCIPEGFSCSRSGDYRGHLDQLKLRAAIDRGMKHMSRHFDNLQYVGVIQVDTKHVHCHLAMADFGKGYVMPDGTQRGKLNASMKRDLRHGVDLSLQMDHPLKMMASCIALDKRNAVAFVKRSAQRAVNDRGFLQVLGAVLPRERGFWRAGSNREEMKRPNALVRSFVEGALNRPGSGFPEVMAKVRAYAESRVSREDLSGKEYKSYLERGREGIVKKCMDGVYGVLKKVPMQQWNVSTPMLSVFSTDYEVLKSLPKEDPLLEFGYKLRTYGARLSHHKKERDKYRSAVEAYDRNKDVAPESVVVRQFFDYEAEYQAKLASKYQSLMGFLPCPKDLLEEWEELEGKKKLLSSMEDLWKDVAPRSMSPAEADLYAREVYGVSGGHFLASSPALFQNRMEAFAADIRAGTRELSGKLSGEGFLLDEGGIRRKAPYSFESVKALDLHHLGYDFGSDFNVPAQCVSDFVSAARERATRYARAVSYLEATGQGGAVGALPGGDIRAQVKLAAELSESPVFVSGPFSRGRLNDGRTIGLGADYVPEVMEQVEESVREASAELEL